MRTTTTIKLTEEEIWHLLDALQVKGANTRYKDDPDGYETWQRLRQRLNRALDRVDVNDDVRR